MHWDNVSFNFSGVAVLVTGGTGGLGSATAAAFQTAGADVTITGTKSSVSDYDTNLSVYRYLKLDVENIANIDAVASSIPRLDILVNSAGIALVGLGLDESDPDIFDRVVAMHLTSVHRLSARLAPKLARSHLPGGASVINLASMSSIFGFEFLTGYGAAKTGLLGLTRTLAVRWARQNIRVNAIAAGLTASKMTTAVLEDAEISASVLARVPMHRHGLPEDVAGATLFLCSAAASWITGQTLPVDGGFSIAG